MTGAGAPPCEQAAGTDERSGSEDSPVPCEGDEQRCVCGSLLARLVPGGVEVKCRRCKRTLTLPLGADAGVPEG